MRAADVRRIEAAGPAAEIAAAAVGVLERTGLLVHPTSTVYGIGGASEKADAEVARLKGRSGGGPLLRIGYDVEALRRERTGLRWTAEAERLARSFWPGPLTLVLDDGTEHGIGYRVEAHPVTRDVLRRWGGTMSSTSLNPSGERPAATPEDVRRTLSRFPDPRLPVLWLDGGELPGGPPSTLLSLRSGTARLLRSGAVEPTALEDVLGREVARG